MLSLVAALLSCSSDDEPEQRTDGRKLRQLTIAEVPVTRATLTASASSLGAAWEAGDQATYFNVSSFRSNNMDHGTLKATASAETSTFTGKVYCNAGDNVALFYPQQTVPEQDPGRGKFNISLDGQKGTLEDIAERFHYVYGVAKVTSVTDNTANATINNMKSLLAVVKFTFVDGNNAPIPVETLDISFYDQYGPKGYPQSVTVTPSDNLDNVNAVPNYEDDEDFGNWNSPLTITFASETSSGVYVALFPYSLTGYLYFSVKNNDGTYTGTAKATLKAGKYYPVTLKLN